jgi:hypothetical protein
LLVPTIGIRARLKMSSPRTPDSGGSPQTVAVERVTGGTVELSLLTKSNYTEWCLVMQVSLEALGLWSVVETGKGEHREDRLALSSILRAVPSEMKAGLAVKPTTKEAWGAVRSMRVSDDRVKVANVERLMKAFETVTFRDSESVDEFVMRINDIVSGLRELGEKIEDGRVVRKILRVLPRRMRQVVVSIQMLCDLNTMSVEELLGRLRVAEEQDDVEEESTDPARLLLTEQQWEARRRKGKERVRRGEEKYVGCSGGHSEDDDDASSTCSGASRRSGRYRGRCFDCGERGHMARNCPRKKKEKAMLADVEGEYALL